MKESNAVTAALNAPKGFADALRSHTNNGGTMSDVIRHNGVTITVEKVTPAKAALWLASQYEGQRNVDPKTVAKYARDMKEGRWEFTDAAFAFDTKGRMMQGGHRSVACVESGVSFFSIVVRNLPTPAYLALDGGRKRTAGHQLKALGHSRYNAKAAIARLLVIHKMTGEMGSSAFVPSTQEVVAEAALNPMMEDAVDAAYHVRGSLKTPISVVGAFYAVVAADAPNYANWFVERLADGANLSENEPVRVLRERLIRESASKRRTRPTDLIVWFIKAWNATVNGDPLTQNGLRFRSNGPQAESFPEFIFPDPADDKSLEAA